MELIFTPNLWIILPAIYFAGLVDSMAGGGGLISITCSTVPFNKTNRYIQD